MAGRPGRVSASWATTTRRYAFTGASPEHLLGFLKRFPHATVVRLEENYRSTPGILELANRLAPRLGGMRKTLRATRSSGPPPIARAQPDERAEVASVVEGVRRLAQEEAVPLEEIAVLYRIDARSEPFEEAFAAAGVPYQVRDGVFLRRPGPRSVLQQLRRSREEGSVAETVDAITLELGYDPEASRDSDDEITRQSDLARMRSLASEFERAQPRGDAAGFVAELTNRFSTAESGRGVNLLTYHRAKGLEFDAVFSRGCSTASSVPSGRAKADPNEERRLLYVGLTRARRYLFLTWAAEGRSRRARSSRRWGSRHRRRRAEHRPDRPRRDGRWRPAVRAPEGLATEAGAGGRRPGLRRVPRSDARRDRRAEARRSTDLAAISGVGPAKLERYADEVLEIVGRS